MSEAQTEDKLASARSQALAQYESIVEMVADADEDAISERKDEIEAEIDDAYDEYKEAKAEIEEEPLDRDDWLEIEKANKSPIAARQEEFERLDDLDTDKARERIQEDALSVQVRSGWYTPGDSEGAKPEEFEILLCTGGPAVRILGELTEHGEPDRAWMECQDWFTPWTRVHLPCGSQEVLLAYARCFYFGDG